MTATLSRPARRLSRSAALAVKLWVSDAQARDTGQARSRDWRKWLPADHLVLALLYFCAARLALLIAFEKTQASPFWPPSGIALSAIILLGPGVAPGITWRRQMVRWQPSLRPAGE